MEDIKEQIQEQPTQETQEVAQEAPQVSSAKEDLKAANLATMRQKLEQESYARQQAERRNQELEKYLQQQTQPSSPQPIVENDDDLGDPEDYVPVKKLKKFTNKQSESDKRVAKLEQEIAVLKASNQINSIKDYNEVVNTANLETLARLYPEDYKGMIENRDLGGQAKMAYNMIKNYGILDTVPALKQTEHLKAVEKKIEQNKQKPPAAGQAAPTSSSPLTQFGRYDADGRLILSEKEKDAVYAQMRQKQGYR